jgi:hypothetical protein
MLQYEMCRDDERARGECADAGAACYRWLPRALAVHGCVWVSVGVQGRNGEAVGVQGRTGEAVGVCAPQLSSATQRICAHDCPGTIRVCGLRKGDAHCLVGGRD